MAQSQLDVHTKCGCVQHNTDSTGLRYAHILKHTPTQTLIFLLEVIRSAPSFLLYGSTVKGQGYSETG